jgi:hypothetical protein
MASEGSANDLFLSALPTRSINWTSLTSVGASLLAKIVKIVKIVNDNA